MSGWAAKTIYNKFIFIPLGGCNEIGMNLNLYQYKGEWIAVDCGIGFVDKQKIPGVDVMIPSFEFIKKNNIRIQSLLITHAHEDHIGGVCYAWEYFQCPVYATKFAKLVLQAKAKEFGLEKKIKIIEIETDAEFRISQFRVKPICITHSIPEMQGFYIETEAGNVFHTGDWKFDDNPIVGEKTNFAAMEKIKNVSALICDSTNAGKVGKTPSEGELEENIYNIVKTEKGLVVATTFASNVARLQTLSNVAKRVGRDVFISGSSISRIYNIAKECGYLSTGEFSDIKEIQGCKREKSFVICTGCQGEENASLVKIANNDHRFIKIKSDDAVLFVSKMIPGNETSILSVVNKLINKNVKIYTEQDHKIHASGHPYQDDLLQMYQTIEPKSIIPVHGDWLRLQEHQIFIKEKYSNVNALRLKNGSVVEITKDGSHALDTTVESGYFVIDGKDIVDINAANIQERKRLSKDGMLLCFCDIKKKNIRLETVGCLAMHSKKNLDFINKLNHTLKGVLNKNIKLKDMKKKIEEVICVKFADHNRKIPLIRIYDI